MANRKNQSLNKANKVIDKFIKESGEDFTGDLRNNVNWATGEEVESLKRPNSKDFFEEVKSRTTNPVSEEVIEIGKDQISLNLIFRNSLNIRDMGNPIYGEEDKSNKENLRRNILLAKPEENKVCVIYGGDLLGNEWELKRLNNAKIISQVTTKELKVYENGEFLENESEVKNVEVKKALFFALGEKVKVLKRDIQFALSQGIDVYLMNGAQEEKINKYFKINVLKTIVNDINNDRLHLIEGVNSIINVAKQTEDGIKYSTIGLLTNNSLSKSRQGQSTVSSVKINSGENRADVVFVTNTNIAGKKDKNVYYVSGESTYINMAQKKIPVESPKFYNTFSLFMNDSHDFVVMEGHNFPEVNDLEMVLYRELKKQELIKKQIINNLKDKLDETYSHTTSTEANKIIAYYKKKKNQELEKNNNYSSQNDEQVEEI